MSKFDKTTVEYTAKLARMKLSEDETGKLASELGDILKYIEKLNQVDTSKVEPASHTLPLKNIYREDKVRPSLKPEDALKNASQKEGNFFKVPRIIE